MHQMPIADRWRGFQEVADSRHLNNRVGREVVDALAASVRAAYPRRAPVPAAKNGALTVSGMIDELEGTARGR